MEKDIHKRNVKLKQPDKSEQATEFFREENEIGRADVVKSAHYTYRDGFRLGFGIFCGFLLGSLIVILLVYVLNLIIGAF